MRMAPVYRKPGHPVPPSSVKEARRGLRWVNEPVRLGLAFPGHEAAVADGVEVPAKRCTAARESCTERIFPDPRP